MKRSVSMSVVAAMLFSLATNARAQGTFNEVIVVDDVGIPERGDGGAGPRVGVELLSGSLGAVGGGFTGLLIGASGGDPVSAGFGMLSGIAVGSWLGTSLGGGAMGGRGNWGASFAGTLAGSVTSMVLVAAMGNNPDNAGLMVFLLAALPVAGGSIGYEISHAMNLAPSSGPLKSVHPSLSLSRDGKNMLSGFAGTF